jgi:small subunit ribosomal protein S9
MVVAKEAKVNGSNDTLGTGRRKTSVARVRIRAGQGVITVNQRPFEEYFLNDSDRRNVLAPLVKSNKA